MLVLTCLVVNDGKVFSVPMSETQMVDELTNAICWKIDSSIEPNDLMLCAAKNENGQWLHLDEDDLVKMRNGDRIASVDALMNKKPMPVVRSLSSASFGFLTDEAKQEDTIHVLVEVAADRWAQLRRFKKAKTFDGLCRSNSTSTIPRTAPMDDDIDDGRSFNRVKRYAHSNVNSKNGKELLDALNITVESVRKMATGRDETYAPVPPFQWANADDGGRQSFSPSEVQQRGRYYNYINDNIREVLADQNLCVCNVENGPNVLSVRVPGHNIELTGRTDLLILSDTVKTTPSLLPLMPNAKMLIEVKRAVRSGSVYQGLSELIALDLLTQGHVMALVTDLANEWQFFWISNKTETRIIVQTVAITSPGEAFQVIRAHLGNVQLPAFDRPVKKRKLETMLASICEEDGSGIGASLQQYFDVASELGPDIEMARAVAQRLVGTLPSLSMYT